MVEKLAIASYNYTHELLNQRAEIVNAFGYKKYLALWQIVCFLCLCCHFKNKMSFGATLFSHNHPEDPSAAKWVGSFWLP